MSTYCITPIYSNISASEMENAFNDIGFSEHIRNVHSGKPIIPGTSYPKTIPVKTTIKEAPLKDIFEEKFEDPMPFLDKILKGETNPLFEEALRVIRDAAKKTRYHWKELFRMVMYFGCFSFFGREDFSFDLRETKYTIEFYFHYIDPSIDTPDLMEGDNNVVYYNRKFTSVIYNKTTGVVSKSEITNNRCNATYVWDCRTGKKILTRFSSIAYDNLTRRWYDRYVDNVFYNNGYIFRIEFIYNGACGIEEYPLPEGHQDLVSSPVVFEQYHQQLKNGIIGKNVHHPKEKRVPVQRKRPTASDFPRL